MVRVGTGRELRKIECMSVHGAFDREHIEYQDLKLTISPINYVA